MESLALLALLFVVGIPTISLVALVRTGRLRKLLDEQYSEHLRDVSDLKQEIAALHSGLTRISKQVDQFAVSTSAAPNPETHSHAPESAATVEPAPIQLRAPSEQTTPKIVAPTEPQPVIAPQPVAPPPKPTAPEVEPAVISASPETELAAAIPVSILAASGPSDPWAQTAPPRLVVPPVIPNPRVEEAPRVAASTNFSSNAWYTAAPPRKSLAERLRGTLPFEELLGMNLFAKFGIILLVTGFALLGRVALVAMGPSGKVALLYAAASALLGAGIWLERKERYRLVGRTGIGGGWALLFFTTYAMHHVPAMQVMASETLNCVLLLGVAVAMVAHTLRYQSQLVTGLAFLLAFSTVALSQDSVYALTAGAILAVGIVVISLRMGWYELEVFGILATYLNHLYWLYKIYPEGVAGHPFPQFWPSTIILILYWLTFRISYVVRGIRGLRDEHVSTIAALLNTALLLAVMKFQSTHPELTFYALLVLGAFEFFFGQLPAARRRRPAFILLTVLGTVLMFAAVPFRFTGNNIAVLWMIAAEVLLIAGIAQSEVVFRRLGLITGLFTGLLIAFEAKHIVDLRMYSEAPLTKDGILLLTCSACFYLNAHLIRHKWKKLFESVDGQLATAHSYIGGITAFIGAWGLFTRDWTALAWAVLMLAAALGTRYLGSKHLLWQGWALAAAVIFRAAIANVHSDELYPHHIATRLITLPILALIFYLTSLVLAKVDETQVQLRPVALWAGSALLVVLAWFEIAPAWVAIAWMAFAVALALIGRRTGLKSLCFQEHALTLLVAAQLVGVNLDLHSAYARYLPFIVCAAALYAISRFCTVRDSELRSFVGYAHTWAATALLAGLAWHEAPQPWVAPIWAGFALALALVDRAFEVEELPIQAHVLASLAVLQTVGFNMYTADKWHGLDLRLITVSIMVIVLYSLARWVRIPQSVRDHDFHHVYSWVGSFLTAWMLWSELQPVAVAVGIALFGLVLFELGGVQQQRQLRLQAYCALSASFIRIFFVNLTAVALPGERMSPRVYTVLPLALIYFFVWTQLESGKDRHEEQRWPISDLIAYFGTGCIAALLYFQTRAEWIVVAWAGLVLALIFAEIALKKRVFLQQATLLTLGIVGRGLAHNVYGGSYFTSEGWHGNFVVLSIAAALFFAALPAGFRLRSRYTEQLSGSRLGRLFEYPEQLLFFAPIVLITAMIAVKMTPGMITLSLAIEGVLVILLGLILSQRSYRLTGLLLLLVCVAKIVSRDAWRLTERDRYITFIVLGAGLTLVSMLYNKYRESVRRLL
jgi:hypothetical protein